jgi:hypothetical protein
MGCCGSKSDVDENAHGPSGKPTDRKRCETSKTSLVSPTNSSTSGITAATTVSGTSSPNVQILETLGSVEAVDLEEGASQGSTPRSVTRSSLASQKSSSAIDAPGIPSVASNSQDQRHKTPKTPSVSPKKSSTSGNTSTITISEISSSKSQVLASQNSVEVANIEGGASQSSTPRSVTRSSPASRLSPSVLGENAIDARGTHNDNDSITSIPSLAVTSNPQDYSKPSQYNEELTSVLFPVLAIFRNRNYQNLNDTDSMPSVPNINASTGSSIDIRNNGAATVWNSHRKEKKSPRSDSSTQSAPAAVQVPSSSGRDLEHHDGSSRNSTFTSWSRRGHRKNFSRVSELARRGVDVNCDDNSIGSSLGSVPEYDSVDAWTIDLGNLKRTNPATNVEQPTTGGSGNGEGSSYTSVYTMVPEWRETTITGGSGNGEGSSYTSVYTMVPEWRETTITDGSGNGEGSSCTSVYTMCSSHRSSVEL